MKATKTLDSVYMLKTKYKNICIVLISLFSYSLFAQTPKQSTEAVGACPQCSIGESKKTKLNELPAEPNQEASTNWLDATFVYNVRETASPEQAAVAAEKPNLGMSELVATYKAYRIAFGTSLDATEPQVKSFSDSISFLKSQKSKLSSEQKITLLSMMASKLGAGYSETVRQNTDLNSLFLNANSNKKEGGICGDIHTYVSEAAKALGFEDAGIHSLMWFKTDDKKYGSGHAISHFRDPETGEYFVQNYSTIFRTHQKTLQNAVEVSTRLLGPLTGQSDISSRPGVVHLYTPRTAEWVKSQVEEKGLSSDINPQLSIYASATEQTLSGQVGTNIKGVAGKAFFVHSTVKTDEGKYGFDALGLAVGSNYKKEFKDKMIDEVSLSANMYGGYLHLFSPTNFNSDQTRPKKAQNYFGGTNLKGSIRINKTTGQLEINSTTVDAMSATTELRAKVKQDWSPLKLETEVERNWQIVPQSNTLNGPYKSQVKYDRVGVIWNSDSNKAYIQVGADVYFMEGADKMSAVGIKNAIKAVVPAGNWGTFSAGVEVGKIVQNKSKDPFYDLPAAKSIVLDWTKKVLRTFRIGAKVEHTTGNGIQPFSVIGPIGPELQTAPSTTGLVYLTTEL